MTGRTPEELPLATRMPSSPGASNRRPCPDPKPTRLLVAFAGLVSASALVTAMLPSIVPADPSDAGSVTTAASSSPSSIIHVTRYVTLAPGQTAPPDAPVLVQANPSAQVGIAARTRQSGKP